MAEANYGKYVFVWEKYRPALLSMMSAAKSEVQNYKLSKHEFQDLNSNRTTGYSFTLEISDNRVINAPKQNLMSKDLLYVLQHNSKAKELMTLCSYKFKMDKDFNLQITREEIETEEESAEEDSTAEDS